MFLSAPRYTDFLTALFRYILKADSKDDERPLLKAIEKVDLTLGRETFMTIAESLIQEGIEKGKEDKGRIMSCRNKAKLDNAIEEFVTAHEKAEVLRELD